MRGWLLCGMLLLAVQAVLAETLRVDALRLTPESPWRRGDPAQEKEDGVYLLEWPLAQGEQGVALQLALPRQATPLKADSGAFHANLRKKWTSWYGKRAEIGEIEIAGVRWLACRRPAGDGGTLVFQFATVHGGRAYSLLAFSSPQATGLPKPVYDLLAGVNFGPEARHWVSRRVMTAQPGREALAALVQVDAERLGQNGMLTGYGVEYSQPGHVAAGQVGQGMAWFMEGFKWRALVGRDERLPFSLRGHLEARAPARALDVLTVSLRLVTEAAAGAEVEVSLLDLCAPAAELDAALARLEHGARAPLERLARERPAACPAAPTVVPPKLLLARSGHDVVETLEFPLSPVVPLAVGLARVGVVAVRPRLAAGEDALGQGLLRQLGLYFVYARD